MRKMLNTRLDAFELIIVGLTILSGVLFLFLPENSILAWFTTDDAFYYFVTARNISLGLGSTFDGIALTNGYHPLWLLICIPIFALSRIDLILPLRLVIFLQYALSAASGILLYRLARKHIPRQACYIIVLLWLLHPAIHADVMLGGVESTLNGLMIIAVLAGTAWARETGLAGQVHNRRMATLGILSGLTILARLDNVFLIAFVGLWILVTQVMLVSRQHPARSQFLYRLYPLAYFILPVIVIFGAYLVWNQANFGSVMPISGAVKQWWGEISGDPYGAPPGSLRQLYLETFSSTNNSLVPFWLPYKFGQALAEPVNHLFNSIGLPALAKTIWILLGLGLMTLLDLPYASRAIDRLSLLPLSLACAAQIAYYKLGGSVATRPWYWVQELLLFVLFTGIIIGVLLRVMDRHRVGKVLAGLGVALGLIAITSAHLRYFRRNFISVDRGKHEYWVTAEFLERETEDGSIIGLVASGSAAYFTQGRTIVNLDGLINGFEYFQALEHDQAAAYLRNIGMDYVLGSREFLLKYPPYASNFSGHLIPVDGQASAGDRMTLWRLQD